MTPRWDHGWNILAVGMLFQAVSFGIGIYCFTFWVAPWSDEFGVGRGQVMTVYLTLQVAMGAFAPLAGHAVDRFPVRLLVVAGAVCLSLALALAGRATALWQITLVYGTLVMIGMLLAGPLPAQTLAARWFTRRRGLALGVVTVGTSLGGFALPPLVTWLQAQLGWRAANDVLALGVLLIIVPPVWLLVRNPPADRNASADASSGAAREGDSPHAPPAPVHPLRSRRFWLMMLAFTPLAAAFGGAQQNLAPYTSDHGIDSIATAYLVSLMALSMMGAKVFFGALADRWDLRWLFFLVLAVLLLAFLLMRGSVGYGRLLVICSLLGMAAGGFLPLLAAFVSSSFPVASFGRVMGMVGPFSTLAAAGPWLAGYLRDATGSYDAAWLTLALLLLPAAGAMALLRPARRTAIA